MELPSRNDLFSDPVSVVLRKCADKFDSEGMVLANLVIGVCAGRVAAMEEQLAGIKQIIEDVDGRAQAADGPVTPTSSEITDEELYKIYQLAGGE